MRIRKHASKLLGWASCSAFPSSSSPPSSVSDHYSWSPAPPPTLPPEEYAGELQCQLNLSPWDAIESPQCTNSQESKLEAMNEDQPSVFEDGAEAKEEEKEKEEKMEDYKGQGSGAAIKCKKTDGKGWHCKRLAQNPHSLCTYHLTQLRSYRARFDDQVSGDHRKKSAEAVDHGRAVSNYYYYYSILGPWWGKRRGPVNESSDWGKNTDGEAAAGGDNGEEEEDEEDEEEEDNGQSRSDVSCKKKKKRRVIKRRGRKPVKARSLKSLL